VADQIDNGIDGLGTSTLPQPGVKITQPSGPLVVTDPPYAITECNQMLMFSADYIVDLKDFRLRKTAFYMVNVYSIFMFQTKNANSLIHSVNFAQMQKPVEPLKGGKGCIIIDSGKATADMTICFKSPADTNSILSAFDSFNKCRLGDNLVPIPATQLNALVKSCGGKDSKKKKGSGDEMDLDIRGGNKWDADRAKYFQPVPISVPGSTLPKKKEKKGKGEDNKEESK